MITIEQLRTLFEMQLKDERIQAHLDRANFEFKDLKTEDATLLLEVIGCKAMYYLSPLLWVDVQNRADEYDNSLETFRDVEKFQSYWWDRSTSAVAFLTDNKSPESQNISMNAV